MFRNLLIVVATFGLGWGGSFAAGITYGQRQVSLALPQDAGAQAQSGARATGASTPQPGVAGQIGGSGGQGGPGGRLTVGTVSRIDGLTVYLTTRESQEVAITVSGQTPITRPEAVAFADLVPGTRVTVTAQGAPGATTAPGAPLVAQSISVIAFGTESPGVGGRGQVGSSSGPVVPAMPTTAPAIAPTNVSSQLPTLEAVVAPRQPVVSDAQSTPTEPGQGQRGPRADAPRPGQGGPGAQGQGARVPGGQGAPEGRPPGGPAGQIGGSGQGFSDGRGPAAPPPAP